MKYSILLTSTLPLLTLVGSRVIVRRADDPDVLNFALTLEHIEDAFYTQALSQFDEKAFEDAGYEPWIRARFLEISAHEKDHVNFLTMTLQSAGATAVQACNYTFPYTDSKSFVELSSAFETVGTSAYTGAASLITNKDYLTAAGSILATEARQSSWIDSSSKHQNPWSGSFEASQTSTILHHCFNFYYVLPIFKPSSHCQSQSSSYYPKQCCPWSNCRFDFQRYTGGNSSDSLYLNILTSSGAKSTPITVSGDDKTATIPDVKGTVFAFVTNGNASVTDNNTVAGPALMMFPYNSQGQLGPGMRPEVGGRVYDYWHD
ncbi:hypothetical protein D9758_002544 [Tetrapyrgos nigripes]|uniref:Uncharacterized protein n=1 Tax=Tetrapyrgos nigripes TaxID=182062 RepID=A0A8H5LTW7_9AGAR|nr:hypothetical protein D9758_002544 [Tetrapyrgos nigripes]